MNNSPALLTLGIALYSAAILVALLVGVNAAIRRRRRLAITMAAIVSVLVIAGVVIAILSSTHDPHATAEAMRGRV